MHIIKVTNEIDNNYPEERRLYLFYFFTMFNLIGLLPLVHIHVKI